MANSVQTIYTSHAESAKNKAPNIVIMYRPLLKLKTEPLNIFQSPVSTTKDKKEVIKY